ncbi:hypothetical protein LAM01_00400 [Amylolactobacillus amylophilus]|nr:hypothetical protein LAM01_00400 [Amylolactobacillus amylophilus]
MPESDKPKRLERFQLGPVYLDIYVYPPFCFGVKYHTEFNIRASKVVFSPRTAAGYLSN